MKNVFNHFFILTCIIITNPASVLCYDNTFEFGSSSFLCPDDITISSHEELPDINDVVFGDDESCPIENTSWIEDVEFQGIFNNNTSCRFLIKRYYKIESECEGIDTCIQKISICNDSFPNYPFCENSTPFFIFDLDGVNDSTFISPEISPQGSCCDVSETQNCILFAFRLDEYSNGFVISDLSENGNPNDSKIMLDCSVEILMGQPYCQTDTTSFINLTICKDEPSPSMFSITSIPSVQYQLFTEPIRDYEFGQAFLSLDTSKISEIKWDNGEEGVMAFMLTMGEHFVEIIDINGCSTFIDFEIECINYSPNGIFEFCYGTSGKIFIGIDNSSFLWPDGDTTGSIPQDPGTYDLTITDSEGCISTNTVIVLDSIPIQLEEEKNCTTSSLFLHAEQGNYATSYLWNTGETTENISVSEPGIYSLTITTFDGCIATDTIFVSFPDLLMIGAEFILVDSNSTLGIITVNVSGGFPPYQYSWDNFPLEDSSSINVTEPGIYYFSVYDNLGCEVRDSIIVGPLSNTTSFSDSQDLLFYPNPTSSDISIKGKTGNDLDPGKLEIYDISGTLVFKLKFQWTAEDLNLNISALSSGIYFIKVDSIVEKLVKIK